MRLPNLLLILTDQQRWDSLGVNGNPLARTPVLDRLASESVNFDHAFVQSPLCMPSRVSFLSGRYPSSTGILAMGVPVPQTLPILPHYFGDAGYRTANVGKLHFLPHANRDHRERHPRYGFDALHVSDEPGVYEDSYRAWVRREDPSQLDRLSFGLPPATATWYQTMGIADMVKHPGGKAPREDFGPPVAFPGDDAFTHTAFVAARAAEFLRERRAGAPFALVASFFAPHAPWIVPQRFLDLYKGVEFPGETEKRREAQRGYYAMLSEVDEHVGRILATLKKTGEEEDTIVVFLSDHGEWLGDAGRYGKGYPGDDPVTRVPLLIKGPGIAPGRCSELVEAVDVLPTALELAGLPVSPDLDGLSLAPRLLGREQAFRDTALTEFAGWKTLRSRDWRSTVHADGTELLHDPRTPGTHEYDRAADPALFPVLAEMRRKLLARIIENERRAERVWPY